MSGARLRVALDASATAKRQRTGVGRYAASLLDALAAAGEADAVELVVAYRLSRLRRARFRWKSVRRGNHGNQGIKERWFVDGLAGATVGSCDVFHGLDSKLPRGIRGPLIATLHDVGALASDSIASEAFRAKKAAAFADLAARAARIVCVSAATRDAFRALFPLPDERFAVIHHGVDARFRDAAAAPLSSARRLPQRYLLFVGLLSARKNLAPLVRAFDRVAARDPGLHLVLAGAKAHGFEAVEAAMAGARAKDRIALTGWIADAELPALYAGARAFVFPGLHEGFGLPLLEAMTCGAPVIAADAPALREVGGDAALLVNATDDRVLAEAIERVSDDAALRERLVAAGRARAAGFTWEEAARRTVATWREVAAS